MAAEAGRSLRLFSIAFGPARLHSALGQMADYRIMNYLERADAKFIAQATDESGRRAAIKRLSMVRRTTFWTAIVMTACFLLIMVLGARHPTFGAVGGAIGIGFAAVIQWVNLMKFESDLRLLKMVEWLKR